MNKACGGDGIPVELFQILRDDAMKVLHSICQQTQKTQQWPQDWKKSVFISIPKKDNAKECSNYHTIALIFTRQQNNAQNSPNQASTVCELRTFRCSSWIQKRQRSQRSNCQHLSIYRKSKRVPPKIDFCFIEYAKDLDCVYHKQLWKILQERAIPNHLTCLLRNLYADQEASVRTRHETMDRFKIGK